MGQYVLIPIEWMDEISEKLAAIHSAVKENATPEPAKMLTPDEVAERMKVTRATVYRWIRSGDLDSVRMGRRLYVPSSTLERRELWGC